MRLRGIPLLSVASALAIVLASCDDDPFRIDWEEAPDTVLLYSLARPELNLPSAFNLNQRRLVLIESPGATGTWDIALDTQEGGLVLLTPGAMGLESRARITSVDGVTFDEVRKAPADTAAYTGVEPVPVELGPIYIVQTGETAGAFGTRCVYYAKLEALDIDVELGTLRFMFDSNPVCNSRDLVPPGD
ncbi:MAG: hypothetical protein JSU98_06995 [Gemmatimonadales bacterium]|jgi:hypothetical protein|nr:MAG: hypothetical protein JSU98_06995 [Gemmatimonadales bacterium]